MSNISTLLGSSVNRLPGQQAESVEKARANLQGGSAGSAREKSFASSVVRSQSDASLAQSFQKTRLQIEDKSLVNSKPSASKNSSLYSARETSNNPILKNRIIPKAQEGRGLFEPKQNPPSSGIERKSLAGTVNRIGSSKANKAAKGFNPQNNSFSGFRTKVESRAATLSDKLQKSLQSVTPESLSASRFDLTA